MLCGRVKLDLPCGYFFFNDMSTTEIYTLSLHDALPIYFLLIFLGRLQPFSRRLWCFPFAFAALNFAHREGETPRSEEHTSELQSHSELVCRLLLEKKKH